MASELATHKRMGAFIIVHTNRTGSVDINIINNTAYKHNLRNRSNRGDSQQTSWDKNYNDRGSRNTMEGCTVGVICLKWYECLY